MFVETSKTDFCVLTLYPALCRINLLALTVFVGFKRLSIYKTLSNGNKYNFTSFFPIWLPFLFVLPSFSS